MKESEAKAIILGSSEDVTEEKHQEALVRQEKAADNHRSLTRYHRGKEKDWFRFAEALLESKEKGYWHFWAGPKGTWTSFMHEIGINDGRAYRLLSWARVARQCGITAEQVEGIAESRCTDLIYGAVVWDEAKEFVQNESEIRNLVRYAKHIEWPELKALCEKIRSRSIKLTDKLEVKVKKYFEPGKVYDQYAQPIGEIIRVRAARNHQTLSVRLRNQDIEGRKTIIVVLRNQQEG